jgi:tripartite-type tricarboxylate transporter receptor subunit TctC
MPAFSLLRRTAILVHVALGMCAITSAAAAADQPYPDKPIRLIVPLGPGSSADIISRIVGAELAKSLGQQVVVDTRPGAGGTIGTMQATRANADGYTLLLGTNGTLAINVGLYKDLKYDPVKDFVPIANLGAVVNALSVHPSNPAKTVMDVVAQAKAKPGTLTYASGGAGTSHHLSGELLKAMTGIDIVHVPYRGAAEAAGSVISGETAMTFQNIPVVRGHIQQGRLKGLGTTGLKRSEFLPELPTLDEQGLKGYLVDAWFGFFAPAGTPAPIVTRLNAELQRILLDPAVRASLQKAGFQPVEATTPASFGKLLNAEIARWVPIVKKAGAQVN